MTTATQRKNLLKLAAYLESLPRNYKHFDMERYAYHSGDCDLPMRPDVFAAKKPKEFLANCGTVACAVGHGPAAGIRLRPEEFSAYNYFSGVRWSEYADRAFGSDEPADDPDRYLTLFNFLFSDDWSDVDNHHYGAAARIRYYLATGHVHAAEASAVRKYAPYRKGSRSAKRREIDARVSGRSRNGGDNADWLRSRARDRRSRGRPMLKLPEDPMRQHARMMLAFTDDLLARDYDCPRTKAVVEIARQIRKEGDK